MKKLFFGTLLGFAAACRRLESRDVVFAANETAVESDGITAVNEIKRDGDWVQLAPFGQFPNVVGLQHFQKAEAQDVVNEFQSVLNTPSRLLGLPWYIGHPDHEPMKQRYKDTKAYGRIKELSVRDDGLYGRVKFSEAGKKLIEDEAFHGHSVNWAMRKGPSGKWHPFRLKSVGWTNEPQIPVAPITAANEQQNAMREKLLKQLGLAADATDDQIAAAVAGLQTKTAANEATIATLTTERDGEKNKVVTLTTQLATETGKVTSAQTEAANERNRSRDLLIAQGVREGKILVGEQEAWKTKFDTKFADAVNELSAAKAKINTQNKVTGLGVRNANLNTDRSQQIQDAVNERRAKFPAEPYDQSYAAVKRSKPELFAEATQAK